MDESGPIQTNIHEGCFHARHYPHDPTSKNIANISASIVSLNKDFLQKPVLEQGHPGLHQRDINEDLFAHDCTSSFSPTAAGSQRGTPNSASKAAVSNKGRPMTPL